jgi:hypothetical protein
MTKLISDAIDQKSFSRFKFKILLRNETSHTQLTKSELLSVIELQENGILLKLPLNACQKSHNVTLFLLDADTPSPQKLPDNGSIKGVLFEAISKVVTIEINPSDNKFVTAELSFSQYDVQHWKIVLQHCVDHQDKITAIINKQYLSGE